jgi:hypothetical protein
LGAYFDAMVRAECASGDRVSTDGDSIIIPVVGVTVAWIVVLVFGVGVVAIVMEVRRARRNTG